MMFRYYVVIVLSLHRHIYPSIDNNLSYRLLSYRYLSIYLSIIAGMTYPDFIFFMLSEEDKSSECALRYWYVMYCR